MEDLRHHNWLVSQQKKRVKSYLRLSALSTNRSTGVEGFTFPLRTADDIERLESAVREDPKTYHQYVDFLRDKKTEVMDIPSVMKLLFLDEALDGFNFNGIQGRRLQKRPLKMYAMFIDCMLDAWREQMIDHQLLQKNISVAVAASKRRLRVKRCRENKQHRNRMMAKPEAKFVVVVEADDEAHDE